MFQRIVSCQCYLEDGGQGWGRGAVLSPWIALDDHDHDHDGDDDEAGDGGGDGDDHDGDGDDHDYYNSDMTMTMIAWTTRSRALPVRENVTPPVANCNQHCNRDDDDI